MLTVEEHIDNLIRHIRMVQDNCVLLGKKMIDMGRAPFGRNLIANGFQHDVSKFCGVEWSYLHQGQEVPLERLKEAIAQHQETNPHHPEHHGGISEMSDLYVAEMVCDWFARSQEFGTCLRDWITESAVPKFNIGEEDLKRVMYFVDLLIPPPFS